MKVNIYIGFGTLKVNCTQYGICGWISDLQECKGNGFFEVEQVGINFWSGPKNFDFLDGQLPQPAFSSPKKFVGGGELNALPNFVVSPKKWAENSQKYIRIGAFGQAQCEASNGRAKVQIFGHELPRPLNLDGHSVKPLKAKPKVQTQRSIPYYSLPKTTSPI